MQIYTTDMILVKIADAPLLWCKLICMMGMLKPAIYVTRPASPFSPLLPLRALAGSFTVAPLSPQ
jgi:hypothetical protein